MVILWVCYGYPMVRTAIELLCGINNHQFSKEGAKLRKINGKSKNVALFCPNICIFDFFAVPLHAFSCKKQVIHY